MKKLLFVLVLAAGVLSFGRSEAQTLKIGYTNADMILASLPEAKQIETDLTAYRTQIQKQMESKVQEFEQKRKIYQETAGDLIESVRKDKEQELMSLQQNIQKFERDAQADLQKKNAELLSPVYQKIQVAINDVAKAEGYSHVFSSDAGGMPILLYADEQYDLTKKIVEKLGGKLPEPKTDGK